VSAFTSIEWFACGGGMALGIEEAGFRHLSLVEWEHDPCETLRAAGFEHVIEGDIRTVRIEDMNLGDGQVDYLHASPPCQAWSSAGDRLGSEDDRNGFPWTIDKIDEMFAVGKQPRFVTIENVPGLTLHKKKSGCEGGKKPNPKNCPRCYFDHWVVPAFQARFAWVGTRELCAADYGVAQKRYRIFLVAGEEEVPWPEPTHSFEALVWSKWIDGSYWRSVGLPGPIGQPNRDERRAIKALQASGQKPDLLPWVTVRQALLLGVGVIDPESPQGVLAQSHRSLSPDQPSPVVDCGRTDSSYRAPSILTADDEPEILIASGQNAGKGDDRYPHMVSIDGPSQTIRSQKSASPILVRGDSVYVTTGQNTTKSSGGERFVGGEHRQSVDEPSPTLRSAAGLWMGEGDPSNTNGPEDHEVVLESSNKGRVQGGVKRGPVMSSVDGPSLSVDTVPGHFRVLGGGTNPHFPGDKRTEQDLTDLPATAITSSAWSGNNAIQVETAEACVRCGAPFAPQGHCSRREEGCQGGRGEEQAPKLDDAGDERSGWEERLSHLDEPARTVSTVRNNTVEGEVIPVSGSTIDEPSVTVCSTEYKGARHQDFDATRTPMRASDQLLRGTGRRRLDPEECAILQDFPKDHPFQGNKTSRYEQIGNAVPRRMARALAMEIRKILERRPRDRDPQDPRASFLDRTS
jgi:DNA (cytosine-5)-methyltransferase 1